MSASPVPLPGRCSVLFRCLLSPFLVIVSVDQNENFIVDVVGVDVIASLRIVGLRNYTISTENTIFMRLREKLQYST